MNIHPKSPPPKRPILSTSPTLSSHHPISLTLRPTLSTHIVPSIPRHAALPAHTSPPQHIYTQLSHSPILPSRPTLSSHHPISLTLRPTQSTHIASSTPKYAALPTHTSPPQHIYTQPSHSPILSTSPTLSSHHPTILTLHPTQSTHIAPSTPKYAALPAHTPPPQHIYTQPSHSPVHPYPTTPTYNGTTGQIWCSLRAPTYAGLERAGRGHGMSSVITLHR